ncbi:hypothetical protein [Paenibacillus silviterrae]|uniref:hypothetical protein n=1 Tax=Paenibacillus silviterrae TaxID=3242194 RepID=UPI0025435F72|nr:hypothetical protein [Paenibacillus chinjuensis]
MNNMIGGDALKTKFIVTVMVHRGENIKFEYFHVLLKTGEQPNIGIYTKLIRDQLMIDVEIKEIIEGSCVFSVIPHQNTDITKIIVVRQMKDITYIATSKNNSYFQN